MRLALKIVGGLLAFLVLAALTAFVWFWARPVGINNYLNKEVIKIGMDSPEALTMIGAIDGTLLDRHSHRLADYSKAQEEKTLAKARAAYEGLERYGPEGLEGEELLSWRVGDFLLGDALEQAEIEHGGYIISQLSGAHVNLPSFLTDMHKVSSPKLARNYVARLEEFGRVLDETRVRVDEYAEAGVVAPTFIIDRTVEGLESFLETAPEDNPLVVRFRERMEEEEVLDAEGRAVLVAEATRVVEEDIYPGYRALIAQQKALRETSTMDAGIWRIPNGDEIYRLAVKSNTTTDFTPDELHRIGLSEVARIEGEMDAILRGQGLTEGSVGERVRILMEDPEQIFPNTDEGREAMIAYLEELNEEIMEKVAPVFATMPEADVEIKRVPEFSEDGAPGGYYNPPAMDGSRPGAFYINQKNTADNPKWTLPTLLVHAAAPGHHFQIARSMEMEGMPLLRKFSPFTAYTEGWALYVERMVAEDLGLYADDPLADLGRLQAEMFRAVRLVVDTGLHAKRWTREDAIDFMVEKTGMTEDEVTREIERYIVWPGQALAYKTGQMAILDMRADAEAKMGERFDLREFHEQVLGSGALPLEMLREKIEAWAESESS